MNLTNPYNPTNPYGYGKPASPLTPHKDDPNANPPNDGGSGAFSLVIIIALAIVVLVRIFKK